MNVEMNFDPSLKHDDSPIHLLATSSVDDAEATETTSEVEYKEKDIRDESNPAVKKLKILDLNPSHDLRNKKTSQQEQTVFNCSSVIFP